MAKAAGSSQPYLNQVVRGERKPSADWLDLVADTMELTDEERAKLHRAGAKDQGFKIDLDD
ncbi:MAG: helix-turn-helix transcriptional regulator [Hyphomonadaceae bacterium]|nr:helix-turn-helix transcriptional regulator [Hyphomonadaceae bacterium]